MNRPTDARDAGAANLAFARTLVHELHASGVATAVVCPGSRSAPLALAVAAEPGLAHSVHIDERNAAFHALGSAKATGEPVALVCTSGTAGANFLPAVAEAAQARVPLIVLTADRPPELRAWGAAQTMEQRTLFAGFTRWSEEAPCPSEDGPGEPYARALARRAVSAAMGPAPGPVHLNLPFREPLLPATIDLEPRALHSPTRAVSVCTTLAIEQVELLAKELQEVERGVLVFGPDSGDAAAADEVRALAERLGWPVLADPASGLRAGLALEHSLVCAADLLLRSADAAAALAPELIVRFGGLPTSKAVSLWMAGHPAAEVWLVDPVAAFRDPQHRASRSVRASAGAFCAAVASSPGGPSRGPLAWRARWRAADRRASAAFEEVMSADSRFYTPQLARALWSALPEAATLYAANSMAIRELDAFAGLRPARLRVLANRGVNGIDGQVSAALGAAAALGVPTVLWCGDLALLHDVSGLLAGRLHGADLTIVVSNDDGGGIFEYLPVAGAVPRAVFEEMFAVPHGLDLVDLAAGLGWESSRVESAASFEIALSRALAGGRHVIEVPVDRAANTAFHGRLFAAVRAALGQEPRA
ncbi:MAG TPA: 2-succinyl-5-enolpyruvyl-6-hydroxy-3-cyclohexene-1-carboxylic-acid synthase [Myxococcota bacterium]|nr:2-succinyl-5-enolpyruvyl-6-hydroxy-3-cyclohexene-1-carboxylic-acid synthase [Myxococcota bacterium]